MGNQPGQGKVIAKIVEEDENKDPSEMKEDGMMLPSQYRNRYYNLDQVEMVQIKCHASMTWKLSSAP